MPRSMPGGLLLGALLLGLGCARPGPDPRATRPREPADKEALFGDPSLVPTRDGERIRGEIATAHEIQQAIATLPSVVRSRVDVERPARGDRAPTRVLVVVQATTSADEPALRERVAAMIAAVAGPDASAELIVERSPTAASPPGPGGWPLVLGVLGLGLFAGIFLERARRLRLASRRPRWS